jgi:hypothetical protein
MIKLTCYPVLVLASARAYCRESLGGRLKVMVSGGALLPPYLESFFALTGLQVRACSVVMKVDSIECALSVGRKECIRDALKGDSFGCTFSTAMYHSLYT